ncbi:hypothetical protein CQA48_24320 [Klebsiella pneumoniae]|nr:hypothetical protein CQA48_24320 [Klebsiella pneumoniae]
MPSNGRPRSPHNRLTNKEEDMMPARHQGLLRLFIACALGSALLCFTTAAIVARRHAVERQTSFSS